MTEADLFLIEMEKIVFEALETVRAKNADYGNPDDPFANFREASLVGMSVEQGILVRMTDKLRRAANLLLRQSVVNESVEDTLIDLANYALILAVWRRMNGDAEPQ